MSGPKAIADELRACVERGTYSGGGYKYVEVGPEDAILAADTIDALVKERDELAEQLKTADRQFTALKVSSGKSDARAVDLAAVVEKVRGIANAPYSGSSWADLSTALRHDIKRALSTAPADALAEHDAALIESLADDRGVDASEDHDDDEWWVGYRQAQREIIHWLTKRARQVREGEA